jgi:hypothetical protein
LAGEEVRRMLEKIRRSDPQLRGRDLIVELPERIVVRAAGRRASCRDLWAALTGNSLENARNGAQEFGAATCGAAGRVTRQARIETLRRSWDPLLASWNVVAGCTSAVECVPFLVRVPAATASIPEDAATRTRVSRTRGNSELKPRRDPAVRPGQRATLVWEQNGIRLEIPVVCLDGGGKGATVRARVGPSGRTLRAIVTESGQLRAIS